MLSGFPISLELLVYSVAFWGLNLLVTDLRHCVSRDTHEFELVTLSDSLTCAADHEEALLSHMVHILKVSVDLGSSTSSADHDHH